MYFTLKIIYKSFLVILLFFLFLWVGIQVPIVQNWIGKQVASHLSQVMHAEVRVSHVSFSLFNKLYIDNILIKDHSQDTLLSIGHLNLWVTDYFFLKKNWHIHYLSLNNVVYYGHRTDSIWNDAFLYHLSSSTDTSTRSPKSPFRIDEINITKMDYEYFDHWAGQNIIYKVGHLHALGIQAGDTISLQSVKMDNPYLLIDEYKGKRPSSLDSIIEADTSVYFNTAYIKLQMKNCRLMNGSIHIIQSDKPYRNRGFDWYHIHINHVNGIVKNFSLIGDTIRAWVPQASATEQSGLTIRQVHTHFLLNPRIMEFSALDLQTEKSHITHYYAMCYQSFYKDFSDFLNRVTIVARLKNSFIHADDIAFFAPVISSYHIGGVSTSGYMKGIVNSFYIKNLLLQKGNASISTNIQVNNLLSLQDVSVASSYCRIRTSLSDWLPYIPLSTDKKNTLYRFFPGVMQYQGAVNGSIKTLSTIGHVITQWGTIGEQINFHNILSPTLFSYDGDIFTPQWEIGRWLGGNMSSLGNTALTCHLTGNYNSQAHEFQNVFYGTIDSIEVNAYSFHAIKANGIFNNGYIRGMVSILDTNFKAHSAFEMNIKDPLLRTFVKGRLDHINLNNLRLSIKPTILSSDFSLSMKGSRIDNILGEVSFTNAIFYKNPTSILHFDSLQLISSKSEDRNFLQLKGKDFDINMLGNFTILGIRNSLQHFLHYYYPTILPDVDSNILLNEDYSFHIQTHKVSPYITFFKPNINGFDSVDIYGEFQSKIQRMKLLGSIPFVQYDHIRFSNLYIDGLANPDSLLVNATVDGLAFTDSLVFPHSSILFKTKKVDNLSMLDLYTEGKVNIKKAEIHAQLHAFPDSMVISFQPSVIGFKDNNWLLEKNGFVTITPNDIFVKNLLFKQGNSVVNVATYLQADSIHHQLQILLKDVAIAPFVGLFNNTQTPILGQAFGKLIFTDLMTKPNGFADVAIKQFSIGNDNLGNVSLHGSFSSADQLLKYKLIIPNSLTHLFANGIIDLNNGVSEPHTGTFYFQNTDISFLNQFFVGIFSNFQGKATGELQVTNGKLHNTVRGDLQVKNVNLLVDYTQVPYHVDSLTLHFKDDRIDFGHFVLYDVLGNKGTGEGNITFDNLFNRNYHFTLSSPHIMLIRLKQTDNPYFYGTSVGKASFLFQGNDNDLKMNIQANATDSTTIFIPNSASKDSFNNDGIIFKHVAIANNSDYNKPASNFAIHIDLFFSPKVTFNVVMNQATGDEIEAKGEGKISIVDGGGKPFAMFGRYNIELGQYKFNVQSIYKRYFYLLPNTNSYIEWNGDPSNAALNVSAQYTAEGVQLENLLPDNYDQSISDNTKGYKGNVYVICEIKGTIDRPILNFKIDFPPNTQLQNDFVLQQIISNIESNQSELIKQVAFLVFFNTFSPYQGSGTSASANNSAKVASNTGLTTLSSVLSTGLNDILSNLLSKIFKDKSIRFRLNSSFYNTSLNDYGAIGSATGNSSNVGYTRSALDLKYYQNLLKDRIQINVGSGIDFAVNGQQISANQNNSFVFLPDVRVDFILSKNKKLRLTTFYTDNVDLTTSNGKRNQTGVSLSYRTTFDSLHVGNILYNSKKKKHKITHKK